MAGRQKNCYGTLTKVLQAAQDSKTSKLNLWGVRIHFEILRFHVKNLKKKSLSKYVFAKIEKLAVFIQSVSSSL